MTTRINAGIKQAQGDVPKISVSTLLLKELERKGRVSEVADHPKKIRRPSNGEVEFFRGENFTFSILAGLGNGYNMTTETYTFLLSETHFDVGWRTSSKKGNFHKINGVIAPPGTSFEITSGSQIETLYLGSVKPNKERHEPFDSPLAFSTDSVVNHLDNVMPVKLMVPANPHGHEIVKGGNYLLSNGKRDLVIGPENQEFSAGSSRSKQDFHKHKALHEIYIPLDQVHIHYLSPEKRIEKLTVEKGDAVVVKPGTFHYATMPSSVPTFVIMASSKPILKDKEVVSTHDEISAALRV